MCYNCCYETFCSALRQPKSKKMYCLEEVKFLTLFHFSWIKMFIDNKIIDNKTKKCLSYTPLQPTQAKGILCPLIALKSSIVWNVGDYSIVVKETFWRRSTIIAWLTAEGGQWTNSLLTFFSPTPSPSTKIKYINRRDAQYLTIIYSWYL